MNLCQRQLPVSRAGPRVIAADRDPDAAMPVPVQRAAAQLHALGVAAAVPDEPEDHPGSLQPGGRSIVIVSRVTVTDRPSRVMPRRSRAPCMERSIS